MKLQEVIFFLNHRNCSPPRLGVRRRQKPVRWLHNWPLKLNEWLLNVLNRLLPWSSLGEQFLQFSNGKFPFVISPHPY